MKTIFTGTKWIELKLNDNTPVGLCGSVEGAVKFAHELCRKGTAGRHPTINLWADTVCLGSVSYIEESQE